MSLSSKGCYALVKFIENHKHGIVAELTTKRRNKYFRKGIDKKKDIYISDFTARALFYDKGEQLNTGDIIKIKGFYLRNRNKRYISSNWSLIITDWVIVKRNPFVKRFYGKSKDELDEIANRQREAIEEEMYADEQNFDEYLESIEEDGTPF